MALRGGRKIRCRTRGPAFRPAWPRSGDDVRGRIVIGRGVQIAAVVQGNREAVIACGTQTAPAQLPAPRRPGRGERVHRGRGAAPELLTGLISRQHLLAFSRPRARVASTRASAARSHGAWSCGDSRESDTRAGVAWAAAACSRSIYRASSAASHSRRLRKLDAAPPSQFPSYWAARSTSTCPVACMLARQESRRSRYGPPRSQASMRRSRSGSAGHAPARAGPAVQPASPLRRSRAVAPCSSLITRAAKRPAASTPAPPTPYRQPKRHGNHGNRDVPRSGGMGWTSMLNCRDQGKGHGMLLSGIAHDDRSRPVDPWPPR